MLIAVIGVRAGAGRHGIGYLGGGQNREGERVERAVAGAAQIEEQRALVLRFPALDGVKRRVVQAAVRQIVLGVEVAVKARQLKHVVERRHDVTRCQRIAVVELDVVAQHHAQAAAVADELIGIGELRLGHVVVVHGEQALVHQIEHADHVALVQLQRAQLQVVGGDDGAGEIGGGSGCGGRAEQKRDQQRREQTPRMSKRCAHKRNSFMEQRVPTWRKGSSTCGRRRAREARGRRRWRCPASG